MKQNHISFLGSAWMPDVERIEDNTVTNNPAVAVFPVDNFFPQGLLMTLIEFANINEFMFYIDVIGGEVRMRIFEDVES